MTTRLQRTLRNWLLLLLPAIVPVPLAAQNFSVVIQASPQTGPAPLAVQLTFQSQPRGIYQRSATMSFSDGTESWEWASTRPRMIPHVFERPGEYTVTVSMTDTAGTVATSRLVITVSDSVTVPVRFSGHTLAAEVGGRVCVGTGADTVCTTVAQPDDGGLPLPRHLADRLGQRDAEEAERARLRSALDSAYQGDQLLVHPDSVAKKLYGDSVTDEQRRRVEDVVEQHNTIIADELMERAVEHLRAGRHESAKAVLDSLAEGASRASHGGGELRERIETGRRHADFNRLSAELAAADDAIRAAAPGSAQQSELFEKRERIVAEMASLAERQKTAADAALRAGDRDAARRALLLESAMWEAAAENAGDADRRAYLRKAEDATSRLLLVSPNGETLAQLRHVQVRSRQGAGGDTTALKSASDMYQRAVANATGEGGALVREMYAGRLPPDSLAARLQLLDPADRATAVALLRTGQDLRDQALAAQDRQWRESTRALGMNYDDVERRLAGDTAKLRRFRDKVAQVHSYSMRADSLRGALARCRGDACQRLQQQLNDALNNADTKWYDVYYDYQLQVRDGGQFNATVVSPLTERPIVFRHDNQHRNRDVNVAFSEVTAYDTYFMNMPPEEVVRLGFTTIAVMGAGLAGGLASGLVANLVAAPAAMGAVEITAGALIRHSATRFATTVITDGFVSTYADRYIISPMLNNTALRGSGVEIGTPYAGSIGAELRSFATESAANSVMAAAFLPASRLGNWSGSRAGHAFVRSGGSRLTAAALRAGVTTTYELGALAAWSAGQELVSSTLDDRKYNTDRVREEALNGMAMMGASKITRGLTDAVTPSNRPITSNPDARRHLNATRLVEREYGHARNELVAELAKANPDPSVVDALRRRTHVAAEELRRQNDALVPHVGREAVTERNRAIDRDVAIVDGPALGARSGARVRGNVIEVEPWEVRRFSDDLARTGLQVRRSGGGALVRDPATGESAVVVPREYSTPDARRLAERRARARDAIRRFEIERLGRLPREDAAYMADKYTRRWDELGKADAHSRPEHAERAARGRDALAGAIRAHGAELVSRPGLAASTGRNAQIRKENGRWRVEYDPQHATYLDIKEESRHLSNEVAAGYFRDGATTPARERIAELREAGDRVSRLMAVEAQPRLITEALNRAADERVAMRDLVRPDLDPNIKSLGAPTPRSMPDRIENGTPQQRAAWTAIEDAFKRLGEQWHEQKLGTAQLRLATQRLRSLRERQNWPGADRHIELMERNQRVFDRVTSAYENAHAHLQKLQDAVLRDPSAAMEVRQQAEALTLAPHADLPVLRATRTPAGAVATTPAWRNRWNDELTSAESTSRVNRKMGEEAIEPGGPAYEHIMNNHVLPNYPPGTTVTMLFRDTKAYSGAFDGVHAVVDANGRLLEIVILEAKGGDSNPSTRIVVLDANIWGAQREGAYRAEQGTPQHTVSTLLNLMRRARTDPEVPAQFPGDVKTLEAAVASGKVRFAYVHARTPTQIDIETVPTTGYQDAWSKALQQYELWEQAYQKAMVGPLRNLPW